MGRPWLKMGDLLRVCEDERCQVYFVVPALYATTVDDGDFSINCSSITGTEVLVEKAKGLMELRALHLWSNNFDIFTAV